MNKKANSKKKYVIAVKETLHYRLRQTALRKHLKLQDFVDELLWEGLKARLQ